MKKLISTILTLALIFAVNTTAFASEANKALPAAESVETTEVFFGNTDAVRIGSSEETRSTSLPTSYWSLAQKSYTADLQVVGKHWLYTNYYYHPNGDGKIYVDYSVRADTSTTTFYIISEKDSSTAYFCGHTNSRNNVNVYDYLNQNQDKFILFDIT